MRLHPIVTGLPRIALKDDVIPLASPIVSTTGETISEIPITAGQVFYASFAGYQRCASPSLLQNAELTLTRLAFLRYGATVRTRGTRTASYILRQPSSLQVSVSSRTCEFPLATGVLLVCSILFDVEWPSVSSIPLSTSLSIDCRLLRL